MAATRVSGRKRESSLQKVESKEQKNQTNARKLWILPKPGFVPTAIYNGETPTIQDLQRTGFSVWDV